MLERGGRAGGAIMHTDYMQLHVHVSLRAVHKSTTKAVSHTLCDLVQFHTRDSYGYS